MENKTDYEISEITNTNLKKINECLLLSEEIDRIINGGQSEDKCESIEKSGENSIRTTVVFEAEKIDKLGKILMTIRESL